MRFLRLALVAVALACRTTAPSLSEPESTWQPYDLGSHHRAITTTSPEAQAAFDQGLIWAFAFNHDEARLAFEEAARRDPASAMAWWGVALVNGPHINNPVVDEAHAKTAWDALQKAVGLEAGASEVEQALIDALKTRYADPQPADRAPLDAAYATAMGDVFRRFPSDSDVATLYAEALMDTRPWDQWTFEGQPQPGTEEVLAALKAALALDPDHPGALHLTIHALEASPHPEQAAEAADRLRTLVPDASHLVHMPSHIDVRTGKWAAAATTNEGAIAADVRYAARQPEIGFYALYMAHNIHFLAYTAQMEGRRAVAVENTKAIVASLPPEKVREAPMFMDAFLTVEADAYKRFGMWDEILALPQPPADFAVSTAHWHYVRAVALAATGKVDEAKAERLAFQASLPAIGPDIYWGSNSASAVIAVAVPYLDGEIAYREGNLDEAVAQLTSAVTLEDQLKYDEPPPWTTPSRHALGAVLLAAKRPVEAEAVYRADLARYPANGWSLWGLAEALAAQGKAEDAKSTKARFDAAWARADTTMTSSCACVSAH